MKDRLQELLTADFRIDKLLLEGIDNELVLNVNSPRMVQEEMCLFHNNISNGDEYCSILHNFLSTAVSSHLPAPVTLCRWRIRLL